MRNQSHDAERDRHLLSGCSLWPGYGFNRADDTFDELAAKAYWERHRERLLSKWIKAKPGTRPWGWWKFDAPERRRTVGGRIHPFDDPRRTLKVANCDRKDFWHEAYALFFGMPRMSLMPFDEDIQRDFMKNVLHGRESEVFEEEWNYLQRLNLLRPEDFP